MDLEKIFHELFEFLKFYFRSKTIYSIHSPRLFKFLKDIDQAFVDPRSELLRSWWSKLARDTTAVNQEDLGAGRRNKRPLSIAYAAKVSSSSDKKAIKIARIAQAVKARNILELGTNLGKTTAYLSMLCPDSNIISVDACESYINKAQLLFKTLGLHNISCYKMSFDEFIETHQTSFAEADLIFLDGDHKYNSTIRYFNSFLNSDLNTKTLIIDDIHWSPDMTQAWNKICKTLDTGITLDMFKMGLIMIHPAFTERQHIDYIDFKLKPVDIGIRL